MKALLLGHLFNYGKVFPALIINETNQSNKMSWYLYYSSEYYLLSCG